MVETVEGRYQDALVAKETLHDKVYTGIVLLEGILSDYESRAYKLRDQGFAGAAGTLMDEGRRVVDEGIERARGVVDEGIRTSPKSSGDFGRDGFASNRSGTRTRPNKI